MDWKSLIFRYLAPSVRRRRCRILQMVTSFFEAIAWFIPLVGIILAIYFPATQNLNGEQNGERLRDYPQFKCSSNLKNGDGCGTKYGLDTCILAYCWSGGSTIRFGKKLLRKCPTSHPVTSVFLLPRLVQKDCLSPRLVGKTGWAIATWTFLQ